MSAGRIRQLTVAGVGAIALGAGMASAPGSAQAMPDVGTSRGAVVCLSGDSRTTGDIARDPELPARRVRAMEADLRQRIAANPRIARQLTAPGPIRVRVAVHSIKTRQPGSGVGPRRISRMMDILNGAYRGAQSDGAANTRFRFRLVSKDWTVNRTWYHAYIGTAAERTMKRALRVGGAGTLNIYLNKPRRENRPLLLGWATFPQAYANRPNIDGVVIHQESLLGGSLAPYNKGDTVPHEVGHWLGLYHTFQGRCSTPNDRVADTPAERRPEFQCTEGRDTCPGMDGLDPIHNFMDYSTDTCLNEFTRGQNARMVTAWRAYRR
jgi:Pregnancy-associated plasma protein-A